MAETNVIAFFGLEIDGVFAEGPYRMQFDIKGVQRWPDITSAPIIECGYSKFPQEVSYFGGSTMVIAASQGCAAPEPEEAPHVVVQIEVKRTIEMDVEIKVNASVTSDCGGTLQGNIEVSYVYFAKTAMGILIPISGSYTIPAGGKQSVQHTKTVVPDAGVPMEISASAKAKCSHGEVGIGVDSWQ